MATGFSWPDLIQQNYDARRAYYEMINLGEEEQQPGPAAGQLEIEAFESFLGFSLPPSYRTFLGYHNGWKGWSGDINLLSTRDMQEGVYAQWIREWKGEAWHQGDGLIVDGLVIGVKLYSYTGVILDTRTRSPNGEMEIILWDFAEIVRYANFVDLLLRDTADWEELVEAGPPEIEEEQEDEELGD